MPRFLFIRFFSSILVAAGGRTDGKRTRTATRGSVIDGRLDGVGQKVCLLPIAERRLAALLLHSDAHFRLLFGRLEIRRDGWNRLLFVCHLNNSVRLF